MKQSTRMIALLSVLALPMGMVSPSIAQTRTVSSAKAVVEEPYDSVPMFDSTRFQVRELDKLLSDLDTIEVQSPAVNKIIGPWIFTGYRQVPKNKTFKPEYKLVYPHNVEVADSLAEVIEEDNEIVDDSGNEDLFADYLETIEAPAPEINKEMLAGNYVPVWLRNSIKDLRQQEDLMYSTMIYHPSTIDYAYWDLPVPPTLPEDEVTFEAYMRKLDLPEIKTDKAILPEETLQKIHWLHNFNASAQFSQAYISSNWYQGGNSHIALLLGTLWNVQLNEVYHPNLLFQSTLSYKLGINSSPQDSVHKYSISEDLLQWNLNTGIKAFKKWYYSFNALFKTQILKNYQANSLIRTASFLSPGDFNMGLGMSYTTKKPQFQLTATISPFSYNLKTCITDKIDHSQFNIAADAYTHSEFGSNAEVNMTWQMRWNISYSTRLFIFSDYKYFLSDWEHTLNFNINRFLSTQIYVHMRYDTSSDIATKWKHFMLREVLSFGLSYTFSTK